MHPKANYEFLIKYRGLKLVWMHFSCILRQSSEVRLVWLFISLLSYLYIWILNILKQIFNQLRFSLGTFVSEKKNREYSNCINWLGEIKSSGGRISRDFLQIFAISRFDLAKLQNSAWFVKKFLTYNCGRNWALQICSGTFHIFCRRELAWSWIQGSGPPSCRAINPPEHTRAQVIYGFSQIYRHAWHSIANNL